MAVEPKCSAAGKNSSRVTWRELPGLEPCNTRARRCSVSKIVTAGILYFGAKLVHRRHLSSVTRGLQYPRGRVSAPVCVSRKSGRLSPGALSVLRLATSSTLLPSRPIPRRARAAAIRGNITFDHVTFRYRVDGQQILHERHIRRAAGQTVGIVGLQIGKEHVRELVQRSSLPRAGAF